MKSDMKSKLARSLSCALSLILALIITVIGGCSTDGGAEEPESEIKSVSALGFVDVDGAKLNGVAIEYEEDLTGATVTADMFTVRVYSPATNSLLYKGNGSAGDVLNIYVNDEACLSETGGSGTGHYVVMEMFSDYIVNMEVPYVSSMAVRVTQ
ncbi:MAG: hypothetical protein ACI4MC_02890, partial [Candidatus Coproplasma sp.]